MRALSAAAGLLVIFSGAVLAAPLPPVSVVAADTPSDEGGSITITWEPSPDESRGRVDEYYLYRSAGTNRYSERNYIGRVSVASAAPGAVNKAIYQFVDRRVTNGISYRYLVRAYQAPLKESVDSAQTLAAARNNFITVPVLVALPYASPRFFSPRSGSAKIHYNLAMEAPVSIYIYHLVSGLTWQRSFSEGELGGRLGENVVEWNGVTRENHWAEAGTYVYNLIADRRPEKILLGRGTIWLAER